MAAADEGPAGAQTEEKQEQEQEQEELVKVSMSWAHLSRVLRLAQNADVRRAMKRAATLRCKDENGPLLARMVSLRHQLAARLGYDSHAHAQLAGKMAGTPAAVRGLLVDVQQKLEARRQQDVREMLAMKVADVGAAKTGGTGGTDTPPELPSSPEFLDVVSLPAPAGAGAGAGEDDAGAGEGAATGALEVPAEVEAAEAHVGAKAALRLEDWDSAYYSHMIQGVRLSLDDEVVREYFPLPHVRAQMLEIFQELFGVTFEPKTAAAAAAGAAAAGPLSWHESVDVYEVRDQLSGEPLGEVFLDLYTRRGKYNHWMPVPLRPSFVRADGTRVLPAALLLGNVGTQPAAHSGADTPPLLLHFDDVKTMFHEFAHVCHAVLARTQFSVLSWAMAVVPWPGGVEQDFLEVISMAMEQFVYSKQVLARLSRHHQRPAECLPLSLMERLRAGKHLLAGSYRSGYLASALFDLDVYSDPHVDVTRLDALYRARYEEVTGFRQDEGAHFPACWCVIYLGRAGGRALACLLACSPVAACPLPAPSRLAPPPTTRMLTPTLLPTAPPIRLFDDQAPPVHRLRCGFLLLPLVRSLCLRNLLQV